MVLEIIYKEYPHYLSNKDGKGGMILVSENNKIVKVEYEVRDWYLESFVDLIDADEDDKDGVPITLTVKGAVITGDLISQNKYFKLLSKFIKGDQPEENYLSEQALNYSKRAIDKRKESEVVDAPYIHLENARYLSHNGLIPVNGILWRGKIEDVNGFNLGSLSRKKGENHEY
jgi:hypothetical protein